MENLHYLRKDSSLSSMKILSKYIKDTVESTDRNYFLPFVYERDNKGKLLPIHSDKSQSIIKDFQTKSQCKTEFRLMPKRKNISNVAFLSTKTRSTSRVTKKFNDTLPVGLYNPKSIYQIQSTAKLPLFQSAKFSSVETFQRSASIDFIDMNEVFKRNTERIHNINIEKQIPRQKVKNTNNNIDKYLIPRLELPDYLKKFKGLYHIGEIGKSAIFAIPKDCTELSKELNEKIKLHISNLKNIGQNIKDYGLLNRWR